MGYTVLKISKTVEERVDVAGEFSNEEEADRCAEDGRKNDPENNFEYIVEKPPSRIQIPQTFNFAAI